jgi:hypothetical protein
LYIAVDYGYKGNGAVFAFEEDGILKILDEYASTNETTQNFLDAVYIIQENTPGVLIVAESPDYSSLLRYY